MNRYHQLLIQKKKRPIPVQPPVVPPSFKSSAADKHGPKSPSPLRDAENSQYHLVNSFPTGPHQPPMTPEETEKHLSATGSSSRPAVIAIHGNLSQGDHPPASPLSPSGKRISLGSPSRKPPPPPPQRSPTTKLINRLSGTEEHFIYESKGEAPKRVQFKDGFEEIPKGAYDYDSEGSSLSSASSPSTPHSGYGRPNFQQTQKESLYKNTGDRGLQQYPRDRKSVV